MCSDGYPSWRHTYETRGDSNLFHLSTRATEAPRSLTVFWSCIQGRRLPRVHWRTVSSFGFLCSCSKSGGGSRGGQAVKLAGRNPDMKRRCGIACRHKPRHNLTKKQIPFSSSRVSHLVKKKEKNSDSRLDWSERIVDTHVSRRR